MRNVNETAASNLVVRRVTVTTAAALTILLAFAAGMPAQAQPAQAAKTPATRTAVPGSAPAAGSPAVKPNDVVVSYLAAWNERDARKRRELIAKTWTENGGYTDAHRHGEGHDGIDAMIKAVHDRFAPPYAFRLISGIDAHHGYVRFTWAAGGQPGAPLYFEGTDIFLLAADGRAQQVVGFTNAAPAPASR